MVLAIDLQSGTENNCPTEMLIEKVCIIAHCMSGQTVGGVV